MTFGERVTGLQHMFTPSSKKGTEHQLFFPFTCVLKSKQRGSQNTDNQSTPITTQDALRFAGNDDIPDDIREQQAVALGKCKKEADKQKAKAELKSDDVDICDADKQQEIFENTRQQTQNSQQLTGNETTSEKRADNEHSGQPNLHAGDMRSQDCLHVYSRKNQKHEDGDLQSGRSTDNLVKTFHSSGNSN